MTPAFPRWHSCRIMRTLIVIFILFTQAAFATGCETSVGTRWPAACNNPQLQAVLLEMEAVNAAALDNPFLAPGPRVAVLIRGEATYAALDICQSSTAPQACMRIIAMRRIGEVWDTSQVPDGYYGLSRSPVSIFCPSFATPVRVVRVQTDPVLLWISLPYGTILERDLASRNVVYGGDGPHGSVDLGITANGTLILTGVEDRPMPCMIADLDVLR